MSKTITISRSLNPSERRLRYWDDVGGNPPCLSRVGRTTTRGRRNAYKPLLTQFIVWNYPSEVKHPRKSHETTPPDVMKDMKFETKWFPVGEVCTLRVI
jgi:hypothetical protein